MSDFEKFMEECDIINKGLMISGMPVRLTHEEGKKLLAMVRLLKDNTCLIGDCKKCGPHEQYDCDDYDTMQKLDKIAKGG